MNSNSLPCRSSLNPIARWSPSSPLSRAQGVAVLAVAVLGLVYLLSRSSRNLQETVSKQTVSDACSPNLKQYFGQLKSRSSIDPQARAHTSSQEDWHTLQTKLSSSDLQQLIRCLEFVNYIRNEQFAFDCFYLWLQQTSEQTEDLIVPSHHHFRDLWESEQIPQICNQHLWSQLPHLLQTSKMIHMIEDSKNLQAIRTLLSQNPPLSVSKDYDHLAHKLCQHFSLYLDNNPALERSKLGVRPLSGSLSTIANPPTYAQLLTQLSPLFSSTQVVKLNKSLKMFDYLYDPCVNDDDEGTSPSLLGHWTDKASLSKRIETIIHDPCIAWHPPYANSIKSRLTSLDKLDTSSLSTTMLHLLLLIDTTVLDEICRYHGVELTILWPYYEFKRAYYLERWYQLTLQE